MVAPLSDLLSQSWTQFVKRIIDIAIAAVAAGVVIAVLQMIIIGSMGGVPNMKNPLNLDTKRLEELSQRAQQGDEQAAQDLARQASDFAANGKDVAGAVAGQIGGVMRNAMLAGIISGIVGALFSLFVLLLTLQNVSAVEAFGKAASLLLPYLGITILGFIASLGWIPLIGIIPMIIILPRFILAPLILVQEKKGVIDCLKQSWARTDGFWGKIIVYGLVAGICVIVVSIVVSLVLGMVLRGLTVYTAPIVQMFLTAYIVIFGTKLGLAIMEQKPAA